MGFFAALGTGFAKDQDQQFANQQTQENDLTKLSLQNMLKNVDNYNKSKADYIARQSQAASMAQLTGGDQASALAMINAGVPQNQALVTLAKNAGKPVPGTTDQQTQSALGSPLSETDQDTAAGSTSPASATQGGTTTPSPTPNPNAQSANPTTSTPMPIPSTNGATVAPNQPASAPTQGLVKPTLVDDILGNTPGSNIGANAQAQAAAVTGLNPSEMSQASTGHYTPPTSNAPLGVRLNPSDLVDWSKFKSSDYANPQVAALAQAAYARGDMQTVAGLGDTQQDIVNNEIKVAQAKHQLDTDAATTAQQKNIEAKSQAIIDSGMLNPMTGKAYTLSEARLKAYGVDPMGNSGTINLNPQGLPPDQALAQRSPDEQARAIGYAAGRLKIPNGQGKGGIEARNYELGLAKLADPDISDSDFLARNKAYTDMISGADSKTFVAVGTLMNHLGDYMDSLNNLHLANPGILSGLRNDVANMRNSSSQNVDLGQAALARHGIAVELAKALNPQGIAQEGEINKWESEIPLNTGPKGTQKTAARVLELLDGRMEPMANKYNQAFNQNISAYSLLSPDAQKTYERVTGQPLDTTTVLKNPAAHDIFLSNTAKTHTNLGVSHPGSPADQRVNGAQPAATQPQTTAPQPQTTASPTPQPQSQSNIPTVNTDDDFHALQSGQQFRDPQGNIRTKP